ncbi:MAG TPA: glycosyltransferase [Anaerolineae bacterium]|nr:glycosyltransferase [Anaerolineae bacterium]
MIVSLIVTVLNEAHSLPTLLDSIAAQTRPPDEVIICDGGSTDNTIELLHAERRFPVRVIERPGSNISQGRNAAIAAAAGEVIASTDAGVRLHPQWLEKLIEPLTPSPSLPRSSKQGREICAGFFLPDVHTPFEVAMGATVLPQLIEIQPEKFLPSSRSVAFTRAAWQAVGGYPEWLDYCEDLIFDFALLEKYRSFAFAPEALVYFKPRGSLKSFFRQYYLYARGDGKAQLWLKRHLIRYGAYLVGLPGIALLSAISPWFFLLYLIGAVLYLKRPYQRLSSLRHSLSRSGQLQAFGWVPLIRVAGDIAKMLGFPVGVWWRLTHKSGRS